MMKKKFLLILGFVLITGLMPSASQAVEAPYGMCPVMAGHASKQKFYVDYHGERIYLCCRACVKAFKKHPERYLKHQAPR